MAYTTPEDAVANVVLTSAFWNAQVKNNISYVYSALNSATASSDLVAGTVTLLSGSAQAISSSLGLTQGTVTSLSGTVTSLSGTVTNIVTQPIGTAIGTAATAGSTYILTTADSGRLLMCAGTASGTVQIPLNATQPFSVGQKIDIAQMGTGTVTVTIASGGTLDSTPSAILRTKYSAASVVKINTNEWLLMGDLY